LNVARSLRAAPGSPTTRASSGLKPGEPISTH